MKVTIPEPTLLLNLLDREYNQNKNLWIVYDTKASNWRKENLAFFSTRQEADSFSRGMRSLDLVLLEPVFNNIIGQLNMQDTEFRTRPIELSLDQVLKDQIRLLEWEQNKAVISQLAKIEYPLDPAQEDMVRTLISEAKPELNLLAFIPHPQTPLTLNVIINSNAQHDYAVNRYNYSHFDSSSIIIPEKKLSEIDISLLIKDMEKYDWTELRYHGQPPRSMNKQDLEKMPLEILSIFSSLFKLLSDGDNSDLAFKIMTKYWTDTPYEVNLPETQGIKKLHTRTIEFDYNDLDQFTPEDARALFNGNEIQKINTKDKSSLIRVYKIDKNSAPFGAQMISGRSDKLMELPLPSPATTQTPWPLRRIR